MAKTVAQIKKEMLEWRDFFGGDIMDTDEIKNAKSKKELAIILDKHETFIEMQCCDAKSHVGEFKRRLGISSI